MTDISKLQIDPLNGDWDFWNRWQDGRWEPETRKIIEGFGGSGTFVDIGAWVGPTTLWASPHYTTVVALEPDSLAWPMLRHNTEGLHNIFTFKQAIADYDGRIRLNSQGDSMSRTGTDGDTEVQCYTVETLINGAVGGVAPRLIKMDVEGAERSIIPQAEPYLKSLGTPLLLSCHDWAPGTIEILQAAGWLTLEVTHNEWLCFP